MTQPREMSGLAAQYDLAAMPPSLEPSDESSVSPTDAASADAPASRPRPTFGASTFRPPEEPTVDMGPGRHRGGSVEVKSPRRLGRIILTVVLIVFAVVIVVQFVQAHAHNEEINTLQHHGVPVDVTIQGCAIQQAGTGGTPSNYFVCRGSFVLDGKTYTKVIVGDQHVQFAGAHLAATVDPNNPNSIYPAAVVNKGTPSWFSGTPLILLGLFILALVLLALWGLRSKRHPPVAPTSTPEESDVPLSTPVAEQPSRQPAEIVDQLERLGELRTSGVLTEDEFRTLKNRLLR